MKHKHCDLIIAWANGAEIQWRSHPDDAWHLVEDIMNLVRFDSLEYRIKPESKPDLEYTLVQTERLGWLELKEVCLQEEIVNSIRIVRDGENPSKIKSAEVLI